MNSVCLIGNLTRDPELRYSTGASQTAICRFTIAVNDGYGDKQRTNFIPIVVFNKQAENCDRYLAKGRKVCVIGPVSVRTYTGSDGATRASLEVTADEVEFLASRNDGESGGYTAPAAPEAPSAESQAAGFTAVETDELPF
jgi:single-strand DNA-binding protein